jgi:hypothetical protein
MTTYTVREILEMETLSATRLESVSVKFSGNVKNWIKENRYLNRHEVLANPIAVSDSLLTWTGLDKNLFYYAESENESLLEVIQRLLTK